MRTVIKMTVGGLVVLLASFLFTALLFGLWMGISDPESHYQQLITRELIKNEIDRFNKNYFNSKTVFESPLFESCLRDKDAQGAFDHCKTVSEFRLLYTIDSKTFNDSLNEQYEVEPFCKSLTKHMRCLQKQGTHMCESPNPGEPIVVFSPDGLCSNPVLARFSYSFTKILQVGIVVDAFALLLLFVVWLCLRSPKEDDAMLD